MPAELLYARASVREAPVEADRRTVGMRTEAELSLHQSLSNHAVYCE